MSDSSQRPGDTESNTGTAGAKGGALSAATLEGIDKAALWLLSTEEDLAVETLRHLEEEEVRLIAERARALDNADPETLSAVHAEFVQKLTTFEWQVRGRAPYLRRLAERAFGESVANGLLALPDAEAPSDASRLQKADVGILVTALSHEHPQVVGAVLASIDTDTAANVLREMDAELRQEVVGRIARLEKIPSAVLERAERVLAAGIPISVGEEVDIDGVRVVASLLNQLDERDTDDILYTMSEQSTELSTTVRQAMFRFEDLMHLDRRGFQTLLKEVQSAELLLALKTSSEEFRQAVFASISKRAADMLRDDLEVLGKARLSDVEAAQNSIVTTALALKAEGRLQIAGHGNEEYV